MAGTEIGKDKCSCRVSSTTDKGSRKALKTREQYNQNGTSQNSDQRFSRVMKHAESYILLVMECRRLKAHRVEAVMVEIREMIVSYRSSSD